LSTIPSVAELPVPVKEDTTNELSLAAQLTLMSEEIDATAARPNLRLRYGVAAAVALVLAIGSSLVLLARSGRASGTSSSSTTASQRAIAAPTVAAPQAAGAHESVDGGAVQQSAAHAATAETRDVPESPAPKRVAAPSRAAAPDPPAEQRTPLLPTTRLPNVKIAVGGMATDLKIVPPELLVDERTRLTNGIDEVEQGDYAIARRTFRSAMVQLDSVAARYPESQAIRSLRRELELADARALQACTAENEMRKRRGEEARACQ
jgi:hypothetical protein